MITQLEKRIAKLESSGGITEAKFQIAGHWFTATTFRALMRRIDGKTRGLPNPLAQNCEAKNV